MPVASPAGQEIGIIEQGPVPHDVLDLRHETRRIRIQTEADTNRIVVAVRVSQIK